MRCTIFLLFNIVLCALAIQNQDRLNVTVYYEALCRDSKKFITEQLQPNLNTLETFINLELVPFGKGHVHNINGESKITCQHGSRECQLNEIFACVNLLYTSTKTAKYVSCAMSKQIYNDDNELEQCGIKTAVNWKHVNKCLEKKIGHKLLLTNAQKTKGVTPKIMYVPTIIFDGAYSESLNFDAEENFLKTVCGLLKVKPAACYGDLESREL